MRSRLGPLEPELGPSLDYLHLMIEVVLDHRGDAQRPGNAVHEGDRVDAERVLELGHLEQLVEDNLGDGVALEFDHEP